MTKINEGASTVQVSIDELAKRSDEIGNIVGLISNVAEQTNLLWRLKRQLRARAGEAGRGFSVVADEVRKLAEQSAGSTRHIAELVTKIQQDVGKAINASKEGTADVVEGISSVKEADAVFESVTVSIQALSGGVTDIAASIQKMTEGAKTVKSEVGAIKTISAKNANEAQSVSATTEQQSASMEEIAAAARSLGRLAGQLEAGAKGLR